MLPNTTQMNTLKPIFTTIERLDSSHKSYLDNSLASRDDELLDFSKELACKIQQLLGGNLEQACSDYLWMCARILEEEIYFRRNGNYRLQTIEEAIEHVYGDTEFMSKYLNGILISQVVWLNHLKAMHFYKTRFLSRLQPQSNHLEVGSGHGLLLSLAHESNNDINLTALDISETSLNKTKLCLQKLSPLSKLDTIQQNLMQADSIDKKFDSAVMSELLEHLEDPQAALLKVKKLLSKDGLIYLNVPLNSPAPDHIYLFKTPETLQEYVKKAGLTIVDSELISMTGHELDYALEHKLTVSQLIIAQNREE